MNRFPVTEPPLLAPAFARATLALLVPLLVLALAPAAAAQTDGTARLGFVNGSQDIPAVDVYADGTLLVEDLAYGQASDVVELPAGARTLAVTPAGDDPDEAIIDWEINLVAGAAYLAANVGQLDDIESRFWRIDLSAADAGESRVRVIHASPDAPSVDIAVAGGDVLIAGATFDFAPAAIEVPAATYDLEMRPHGTTDVALSLPDVEVPAATACTVIALGLLGDDGSLEIATIFTPLNTASLPSSGTGTSALAADDPALGPWLLAALAALVAIGATRPAVAWARRPAR